MSHNDMWLAYDMRNQFVQLSVVFKVPLLTTMVKVAYKNVKKDVWQNKETNNNE